MYGAALFHMSLVEVSKIDLFVSTVEEPLKLMVIVMLMLLLMLMIFSKCIYVCICIFVHTFCCLRKYSKICYKQLSLHVVHVLSLPHRTHLLSRHTACVWPSRIGGGRSCGASVCTIGL